MSSTDVAVILKPGKCDALQYENRVSQQGSCKVLTELSVANKCKTTGKSISKNGVPAFFYKLLQERFISPDARGLYHKLREKLKNKSPEKRRAILKTVLMLKGYEPPSNQATINSSSSLKKHVGQQEEDVVQQQPGWGNATKAGTPVDLCLERSLQQAETPRLKRDMDLIDVLWRQDMDLGATREMFDVNLRRELEKERELELHKQQQKEVNETEKQQPHQLAEPQNNVTYITDSETGELTPVPSGESSDTGVVPPVPQQPATQTGQDAELEAAMQYITQQQQQQNLDMQGAQQVPEIPFSRQNSFEQRWEEVANLLNIIPTRNATDEDVDMPSAVPVGNSAALLQNATLPTPQANGTDFISPQPISMVQNETDFTSFNTSMPSFNNSLLDLDNIFQNPVNPVNQSVDNASTSARNEGAMAFPFNSTTDSFLQDLLEEDLDTLDFSAMDLNNTEATEERMDDASSDSAVSSMAGSNSPNNLSDSMSNISSSLYHGVEGATGGHDLGEFSPAVIPKKEVQDASYSYTDVTPDLGFSDDHMNSSCNETTPDFSPKYKAEPRHVAHNHSYPLAPGQQPRERKLTVEEKRASAQMSRDEKKARAMKIPFGLDDIIHSPVDEFNDMLTKYKLSDSQLQLIRDIRRRGKNKVAAQNCRKRKMEVISSLEEEVNEIRQERDRLLRERARLNKGHSEVKDKYNQMYQEVFRSLRDDNGHPYDPNMFTLQQTSDGNVFLVPVNGTAPQRDHEEKNLHKRKGKKHSR